MSNNSEATIEYSNSKTNTVIKEANIISTNAGITESTDKGWRFVPDDEIKQNVTAITGPYAVSAAPKKPIYSDSAVDTSYTVSKYVYRLGIDSIDIGYKVLDKSSGFLCNEKTIGKCSFIELSVNSVCEEGSAIEFYVLDGTKETAILPIETDRVIDEKMFFNLSPRFKVDTSQPIEIKRNGEVVERSLDNLSDIVIDDALYTISYTPLDAKRYYPDNEKISIKVILRSYFDNSNVAYVNNIFIKKYGGGA